MNWKTGRRLFVNNLDDLPIDLDAARFRRIPLTIGGRYGLTDVTARGRRALMAGFAFEREDQDAIMLKNGTDRLLGQCRTSCDTPLLTARSAYWIDEGPRTTSVRSVSLQTGRRHSWRLPPFRADGFRLLQTNSAVLVMQRRNGGRPALRLSRLTAGAKTASR